MSETTGSSIRSIEAQEMRALAIEAGINVPIEQTWVWYEFEETFPDRTLLGFFAIQVKGRTVAIIALQKVKYHGFDFLWAKHGPVWLVPATPQLEEAVSSLIVSWIRDRSPLTAFVRLHLYAPTPECMRPMQMVTYDRTVTIALSEDAEEILAGFSAKGRTNVRRSIKRNPVQILDETDQAIENFADYYAVMAETAQRQGFNAWGLDVYQNMVRTLGRDHVRVFAARSTEGELCGWSLVTVSGVEAVYYYAASNSLGRSLRSPEQLVFGSAAALGSEGLKVLDLMGIGSELAPSLDSLTSFKMKFTKEPTVVAPAWDVPVNQIAYKSLVTLRATSQKLRVFKGKLRGQNPQGE